MVMIHDIVNIDRMQEHIDRKEVSQRFHPEFPELSILNYTDKVQIEGLWTHETRTARGLIFNMDTREVLARPFAKFHNLSEHHPATFDADTRVYHVGDKRDGSLGIVYERPDETGLAVATRGSFESEQAIHATNWLRETRDGERFYDMYSELIADGLTPLAEIIYPENRIVVDYGEQDNMVYLGAIYNESGAFEAPFDPDAPAVRTLQDVLDLPDRKNAEGYVVWFNEFTAVKIKQQDYVELHRIVTGLNRKSVWRALSKGEDEFKALLEQLPDELYAWAEGVAKELREQYATIMAEVDGAYITVCQRYYVADSWDSEEFDRGKFAKIVALVVPKEYAGFMFAMLDKQYGRVQDKIWKMVEPVGGER